MNSLHPIRQLDTDNMATTTSKIYYWGSSEFIEPEHDHGILPRIMNIPYIQNIITISCGEEHLLLLTSASNSNIYACGSNSMGQLGLDSSVQFVKAPVPVSLFKQISVISIASGWHHNLVLTKGRQVFSWGDCQNGALGYNISNTTQQKSSSRMIINKNQRVCSWVPKKVRMLCGPGEQITGVFCGARHSIVLSSLKKIYGFGDNEQGQMGLPLRKKYPLPQTIAFTEHVESVGCGISTTLFLTSQRRCFAAGDNKFGQLGVGHQEPVQGIIPTRTSKQFLKVRCGHHSAGVTKQHQLMLWGTGSFGQYLVPTKVLDRVSLKDLQVRGTFGVAYAYSGEIYTWGSNLNGQLGQGDIEPRRTISSMKGISFASVQQISCGNGFGIVIGEGFSTDKSSDVQRKMTYREPARKNLPIEATAVQFLHQVGVSVLQSRRRVEETSLSYLKKQKDSLEEVNHDLQLRVQKLSEKIMLLQCHNAELLKQLQMQRVILRSKLDVSSKLLPHILTRQETSILQNDSQLYLGMGQQTQAPKSCEKHQQESGQDESEQDPTRTQKVKPQNSKQQQKIQYLENLNQDLFNKMKEQQIHIITLEKSLIQSNRETQMLRNSKLQLQAKVENLQQQIQLAMSQTEAITHRYHQQIRQMQQACRLEALRVRELEQQNKQILSRRFKDKLRSFTELISHSQQMISQTVLPEDIEAAVQQLKRQQEQEIGNYKRLLWMKQKQLKHTLKLLHQQQQQLGDNQNKLLEQDSSDRSKV